MNILSTEQIKLIAKELKSSFKKRLELSTEYRYSNKNKGYKKPSIPSTLSAKTWRKFLGVIWLIWLE